jgi:hypothetical protein
MPPFQNEIENNGARLTAKYISLASSECFQLKTNTPSLEKSKANFHQRP